MSNRRRGGRGNTYRTGYLRSRAWFARRDRWFDDEQRTGRGLQCAACLALSRRRGLELHHTDYAGVVELPDGRWLAGEQHGDLVAMHPYCHELLHRLIDRDRVLSRHRNRRDATAIALQKLRTKLTPAPSKETTP